MVMQRISVSDVLRKVNRVMMSLSLALVSMLIPIQSSCAAVNANPVTFPGEQSRWNGFVRHDFQVDGKDVLVVAPSQAAEGTPWVWHGEFFGHKPAPDIELL